MTKHASCENCVFSYEGWSSYNSTGQCRRYPPVISPKARDGFAFTSTYKHSWCGEHRQKDADAMTKPADRFIAEAFWELCDSFEDGHIDQNAVINIAAKREAEAAFAPTRVRCPKCTANIPTGKHCSGPECPLKPAKENNDG
jgi:hypothetical protein